MGLGSGEWERHKVPRCGTYTAPADILPHSPVPEVSRSSGVSAVGRPDSLAWLGVTWLELRGSP